MRVTHEYTSLQLAYDPARLQALAVPAHLTTARFEAVYREMNGFGMLDLVFEHAGEIFVVHAVGVDVVVLATRQGPALIWPSTLHVAAAVADEIGEMVTPWLFSLVRGRGVAGEYVRAFRPSEVFGQARERRLRGAVPSGETLPLMAPFVYARRFARDRDVFVGCAQRALASAVVGTVARSVSTAWADDFDWRWYGRPPALEPDERRCEVALIDEMGDSFPPSATTIVTTRPSASLRTIVIPVPVPQDHLFTFDPADAPETASFGVRAPDRVERRVRLAQIPAAFGGSGGRIALVVRDDASFAADADTDAAAELARRLELEGIQASVVSANDGGLRDANIVHVFGGIEDRHVAVAAETARAAQIPFVITLEPIAPYAAYYEDALIASLRLSADDADLRRYLNMFYDAKLRFDELPLELSPEVVAARDRSFEEACRGALGILLAPGANLPAFRERFPGLHEVSVVSAPTFVAGEPPESSIAELVPGAPFLLLHGPLTRRSAFAHILTSLVDASFEIVVAGPVSEVDIAFTLRRIGGANVVFLPDPKPAEIAALYRRARAVALPALRPSGATRLIRAALCGALPLVPLTSPLAPMVPPMARFDPRSRKHTVDVIGNAMGSDQSQVARQIGPTLAEMGDQDRAFRAVIETYARAAVAAS